VKSDGGRREAAFSFRVRQLLARAERKLSRLAVHACRHRRLVRFFAVKLSVQLDRSDLAGLERVAEGCASSVSGPVAGRLLALGLVQVHENPGACASMLQLTATGLSLIHSSDQ
jgi:hypothetical protein